MVGRVFRGGKAVVEGWSGSMLWRGWLGQGFGVWTVDRTADFGVWTTEFGVLTANTTVEFDVSAAEFGAPTANTTAE